MKKRSTIGVRRVVVKRPAQVGLRKSSVDDDNPPLTAAELARMKPVALSKRIRWDLGMSQEEFAKAYRIPLGTLRDWEQHRTEPDAQARTLLQLIERNPKGFQKEIAKLDADATQVRARI